MAIKSLKSGSYGRSVMAGNSLILPGDFESIATVTVGAGGSSTITFSSIPSTYKHLQIRCIARQTSANNFTVVGINLNSDAGANYARHGISGDGSTATAYGAASTSSAQISTNIIAANQPANIFGGLIVDILDYTNTNKYKTVRSIGGTDANGAGGVGFHSVLWLNSSAVTTVDIIAGGTSFAQYSSFALYGVKG